MHVGIAPTISGLLVLASSAAAFAPASFVWRHLQSGSAARLMRPVRPDQTIVLRRHRNPVQILRMDVEEHDKAGLNAKTVQHKWVDNKVVCMGLSHKTASVEMREKLAVQEQDWQTVQREIKLLPDIREAAIISTCNRHEIYFVTTDLHSGIRVVTNYLSQKHNVSRKELLHSLFFLAEEEAVWHALRVAGGLDSLVIGEGQILSQMKKCYELSTAKEGAAGKVLSRMFNTAVSAGKRVRTETEIARGGVSISSAAVELVEKQCIPDLNLDMHQLDVCIIGAGKMARLLVQHLMPRKPKSLTIVNRGLQRIEELQTQFPDANIVPAPLDKMLDLVGSCHVCFACTGAMDPILYKDNLEGIIKRDTMLVDISVPRNVDDKGAREVRGVKAYNVDDLKAVVAANQARRQRLISEAEMVLREELSNFASWHQSLGTVPMISKFQDRANAIRLQELRRWENKLQGLTPEERETVARLTKRIVAKLLHGPISHLRTMDSVGDFETSIKSFEKIFKM